MPSGVSSHYQLPSRYSQIRNSGRETSSKDQQSDDEKDPHSMTPLDYRLRRESRRRNLYRNCSFLNRHEPLQDVSVPDHEASHCLGEMGDDGQHLDKWLNIMKTWSTTRGLDSYKDIKVGVHQSETLYGSQTYEPYPDLKFEKDLSYSGGRDKNKLFHGKGTVEFSDGSYIQGTWDHGVRQGNFRIETNRHGVCYIDGMYLDNKMNGKVVIKFQDGTWLEGFCKDGILHGFCRYFDCKDRLTFVGMHRNGKPFGTCWKIIRGGGCVVGRVDEDGRLTGTKVAYIYPDFKTALVGTFREGVMVSTQESTLTGYTTDYGCIKVPTFSDPTGPMFSREISTFDFVTNFPLLRDPYETRMVQVKQSRVEGADQGIFCVNPVNANTVLAFYNGIKLRGGEGDPNRLSWDEDSYKIFDPSRVPNGTIDILPKFRNIENYCASLAHKTNHSFVPNSEFVVFDHPRFGLIPCIASIHSIAAGEEIFVRYGYDLDFCPDWYLLAWENGNYPVPDSMKPDYHTLDTSELEAESGSLQYKLVSIN